MISNQILQNTIDGLKGITRIDLCICDTEGKVLASTFPDAEEYESSILSFVDSPATARWYRDISFSRCLTSISSSTSFSHVAEVMTYIW